MNKISIKFVIFTFVFYVGACIASQDECLESIRKNKIVSISSQFKSDEVGRFYQYKIKNDADDEIVGFVLDVGKGSDNIQFIDQNIALEIKSADGWEGSQVVEEEGLYSQIYWFTRKVPNKIKSHSELTGFLIKLPLLKETQPEGACSDGGL